MRLSTVISKRFICKNNNRRAFFLVSSKMSNIAKKYLNTLRTTLPSLAKDPNDVWFFLWRKQSQLYRKKVTAELYEDNMQKLEEGNPDTQCHPGFDWLLHKIAGLITAEVTQIWLLGRENSVYLLLQVLVNIVLLI